MEMLLRPLCVVAGLAGALNAGRHAQRAYVTFTLALSIAIWSVLSAFASQFIGSTDLHGKTPDIAVRNVQRTRFLPATYVDRIAAIEGARSVRYLDIAVFDCASGSFTVNALGGNGVEEYLSNEGFTRAQIDAWKSDPMGLMANKSTANQCGWNVGTGISPLTMMGDRAVDFHIIAISSNSGAPGEVFGHYDYLNRQSAGVAKENQVAEFHVHGLDQRSNEKLAARIESEFAHDSPAVEAVTDTVNQNAWLRVGKVQYLLALVMAAVFLCCSLVLVSVLVHNASESRGKFGLMQVLGFTRSQLWGAQFAQVCSILLAGAAGGIVAGYVAIKLLRPSLGTFFEHISLPSWSWMWLLLGLGVLLASIMLPLSLILRRVRPVDCREL
jgi:hypothetical protein